MVMADVPAHDQRETVRLLIHTPAHEPRQSDPHFPLFEAAKRRIKAAGLWHCAVKPCRYEAGGTALELHHSAIEFSLQGGVDLAKFNTAYGLHLADAEAFAAYIESEGALEVLCV